MAGAGRLRASAKISEIEIFGYKTSDPIGDDPIDKPQEETSALLLF